MNSDSPIHPEVLMILHVQEDYLAPPMPLSFITEYVQRINDNAEEFRKRNVPVIVVLADELGPQCMIVIDNEEKRSLIPSVGPKVDIKLGDIVCVDDREHPFELPAFAGLLSRWQTETIILFGLYAGDCVVEAINAALAKGLAVKVARDGLADCNYIPPFGVDPEEYCDKQAEMMYQHEDFNPKAPGLELSTHEEIFARLGESKPARAARAVPIRGPKRGCD